MLSARPFSPAWARLQTARGGWGGSDRGTSC